MAIQVKRRLSRLNRARWPLASPVGRMRVLLIALAIVFSLCGGRALQVQAFDAQAYAAEAADQMKQSVLLPALRGRITDRYGDVLAYTEPTVRVVADPMMITTNGKFDQRMSERDKQTAAGAPAILADILARHLGGVPADYLARLTRPVRYTIIAKEVAAATFSTISNEMREAKLMGLYRETAPTRRYPNGSLASNVIGFVNEEGNAAAGLELVLERTLKGKDGKEVYDSSPNGKIPLGDNVLVPAVNGTDYGLTIDSGLQWMAEQRLSRALTTSGATAGVVLVLNPKTGEVLALANGPGFDSNDPGKAKAEDLGNRAVIDSYEPGSVQKVLTFAALFNYGITTPEEKVSLPGTIKSGDHTIHDWWNHGKITLRSRGIFAKSSNVGTITLARRMTKEQQVGFYRSVGLGQRTNVGLPGETAGSLPSAKMADYTRDGISFGTSLSVTALQNAAAVASVVNGGIYNAPKLIATQGGQPYTRPGQQAEPRRVVSAETSEQVRSLMEQQALDQKGPAFTVNGYRMGTKTGTARQVSPDCGCYRGDMVMSTIGIAPVEDPQVLVYAVVWKSGGGSGSSVAAPIMHDVMAVALPRYGVAPSAAKGVKLPLE